MRPLLPVCRPRMPSRHTSTISATPSTTRSSPASSTLLTSRSSRPPSTKLSHGWTRRRKRRKTSTSRGKKRWRVSPTPSCRSFTVLQVEHLVASLEVHLAVSQVVHRVNSLVGTVLPSRRLTKPLASRFCIVVLRIFSYYIASHSTIVMIK